MSYMEDLSESLNAESGDDSDTARTEMLSTSADSEDEETHAVTKIIKQLARKKRNKAKKEIGDFTLFLHMEKYLSPILKDGYYLYKFFLKLLELK